MTPRQSRLLKTLLAGEASSATLRDVVGCNNISDEVCRIREKFGMTIPCDDRKGVDRDGRAIAYGVYSLTVADRDKALAMIERDEAGVPSDKTLDERLEPLQEGAYIPVNPVSATGAQPGSTALAGATLLKVTRASWNCAPGGA